MCKKYFLSVMALVILFVCPVISADDSENGGVSKKDEQPIEKKQFLPWLLDDFKITKAGAELSVSKEKADYYDIKFRWNRVLKSQKIKMLTDGKDQFYFLRERAETSETPRRVMCFYVYYIHPNKLTDKRDNIAIPKDLVNEFPRPLKFVEHYVEFYKSEKQKPDVMELSEILYVFPVSAEEMGKFMSLVPKDQFTAEVYDGFVVLHRIYSKEEAEKRKDFLLNTNGQSKGLWDMVEEYEDSRCSRILRAYRG